MQTIASLRRAAHAAVEGHDFSAAARTLLAEARVGVGASYADLELGEGVLDSVLFAPVILLPHTLLPHKRQRPRGIPEAVTLMTAARRLRRL